VLSAPTSFSGFFNASVSVRCYAVDKTPSRILLIQLTAFASESVPLNLRHTLTREIAASIANDDCGAEQ